MKYYIPLLTYFGLDTLEIRTTLLVGGRLCIVLHISGRIRPEVTGRQSDRAADWLSRGKFTRVEDLDWRSFWIQQNPEQYLENVWQFWWIRTVITLLNIILAFKYVRRFLWAAVYGCTHIRSQTTWYWGRSRPEVTERQRDRAADRLSRGKFTRVEDLDWRSFWIQQNPEQYLENVWQFWWIRTVITLLKIILAWIHFKYVLDTGLKSQSDPSWTSQWDRLNQFEVAYEKHTIPRTSIFFVG